MKQLAITSALAALLCSACGDRPAYWDARFSAGPGDTITRSVGLSGSVAVVDPGLNRVTMLTSARPLELETHQFGVGSGIANVQTSVDRNRLFVLSRGVVPRFNASDEGPKLVVLDGSTAPSLLRTYSEFADPFDQVDVDPLGRWLVVRGTEGVVTNPNELILIDLNDLAAPPVPKTLNSLGGKPSTLTFTSELTVAGLGPRRLLVVSRETDIALLDLDDPNRNEITVQLPETAAGQVGRPVKVAFHDATETQPNPWLAIQIANDSSVFMLEIAPSDSADHPIAVNPSLAELGGVPATIDFVMTDGGLRLAALLQSKIVAGVNQPTAVLVDPATSLTDDVRLPSAFTGIARITDAVAPSDSGTDVALLYGSAPTIAFWALGRTTGTPYRSIDAYDIDIPINGVMDVPGDTFFDHKILKGAGSAGGQSQFYVLDLGRRLSFPMEALSNLTLDVAPDGQRLWGYLAGSTQFARLTFDDLHPISLYTQRGIRAVYDIATASGERSLIALHMGSTARQESGLGATLFDALAPDTTNTRVVSGLAFGGEP